MEIWVYIFILTSFQRLKIVSGILMLQRNYYLNLVDRNHKSIKKRDHNQEKEAEERGGEKNVIMVAPWVKSLLYACVTLHRLFISCEPQESHEKVEIKTLCLLDCKVNEILKVSSVETGE